MATTARGIQYPTGTDPVTPLQTVFASLAASADSALDTLASSSASLRDTTAARPTAGNEGRYFYATDTNLTWFDDGTTWKNRTPGLFAQLTSNTGIPASGSTPTISWSNTVTGVFIDTGGFWSSGSPTRLTLPHDGTYEVSYTVRGNGTSGVTVMPHLNGVALPYGYGSGFGTSGSATSAGRTFLVNGDQAQYLTFDMLATGAQSGLHNVVIKYLGEF